jgi:hypothetical protein
MEVTGQLYPPAGPTGRGADRLHTPSGFSGREKHFLFLQGIEPGFFVLPACSPLLYRVSYSGTSLSVIIIIIIIIIMHGI